MQKGRLCKCSKCGDAKKNNGWHQRCGTQRNGSAKTLDLVLEPFRCGEAVTTAKLSPPRHARRSLICSLCCYTHSIEYKDDGSITPLQKRSPPSPIPAASRVPRPFLNRVKTYMPHSGIRKGRHLLSPPKPLPVRGQSSSKATTGRNTPFCICSFASL
jgi:hypothetical protein